MDDAPSERKTWQVIVPIKDGEGRIVDWRPKAVIAGATATLALAIAREDYSAEADIRQV